MRNGYAMHRAPIRSVLERTLSRGRRSPDQKARERDPELGRRFEQILPLIRLLKVGAAVWFQSRSWAIAPGGGLSPLGQTNSCGMGLKISPKSGPRYHI